MYGVGFRNASCIYKSILNPEISAGCTSCTVCSGGLQKNIRDTICMDGASQNAVITLNTALDVIWTFWHQFFLHFSSIFCRSCIVRQKNSIIINILYIEMTQPISLGNYNDRKASLFHCLIRFGLYFGTAGVWQKATVYYTSSDLKYFMEVVLEQLIFTVFLQTDLCWVFLYQLLSTRLRLPTHFQMEFT